MLHGLKVELAAGLPISDKRDVIADALSKHQIIIVAGETGSGKTTQIPKICLQLGYGENGLIGHTQPRRLAARSVAARIAEELHLPLGKGVGYQVRFSNNTDDSTFLKLMTDGILLAEIQQDRLLKKYEVLIIDEAHERSLNIDFLLGYLKQLAPKRPELKIIVTSATIDVEKFSEHFNQAPVISVSGRTYPVEVLYQPPEADIEEEQTSSDDLLSTSVVNAIHRIEDLERRQRKARGDILVFLSGEREIRDLAQALRKLQMRDTEVLPLYARLSQAEQTRIFASHKGRRIILATNVAETSLTVPGIIYVIDTGLARISRYSVQSKVQRLPIERISQASANQRAGRCGRIANGICIRLYSEEDFDSRPAFTEPEIQRTNLSAVILQMLLLNLGDIADFPFVESPDSRAINDGYLLLLELGAIDRFRDLTTIGRRMASLPADPRLSRMLVEAASRQCLQEMLIIVSALSVQDPREFPVEQQPAARAKHAVYLHPESDFLSWVNLWTSYEEQRQQLSQSALRQYCKANFLSYMRMREWRETHRQLTLSIQEQSRFAKSVNLTKPSGDPLDYEAIHRSVLRGSLNQLGMKDPEGSYLGARGKKFVLTPASILYRKLPKWIVCAELIETHRLFASVAARIEPEWAVEAGQHLVRREHFEAHWEKKRGQVVAFEKVSLYGLTLIERQRIDFSKIDPATSRDIFIREALVGDQLETSADFYHRNKKLIAEIRLQEEKQRRPDILVNDEQQFEFYASRIPADICDSRSFEKWRQHSERKTPGLLLMRPEDLLQKPMDASVAMEFPDHANLGKNRLRINYRFDPGSQEDGVSIDVPLAVLHQITALELEWAVPGQVRERCIALLKALPKSARKQFLPIPEFVDAAMQNMNPGQERLFEMLQRHAHSRRIVLDKSLWQQLADHTDLLPVHLRTRLRLLDDKGKEIACKDSLERLRDDFPQQAVTNSSKSPAVHAMEKTNLREWSCGNLPEQVQIEQGIRMLRFPALVDEQQSVAVRLFANQHEAARQHQQGVARLLTFRTTQQKTAITRTLQQLEKKIVLMLPAGYSCNSESHILAIYRQAFALHEQQVRSAETFEKVLLQGKGQLLSTAEQFGRLLEQIHEQLFAVRKQLAGVTNPAFTYAVTDIQEQLNALVFPEFAASTPWIWLKHYPRYLKAIEVRLQKLTQKTSLDQEACTAIRALHNAWLNQQGKNAGNTTNVSDFPWLLQELRVSLYAQTLKTSVPVSIQRLQKLLE